MIIWKEQYRKRSGGPEVRVAWWFGEQRGGLCVEKELDMALIVLFASARSQVSYKLQVIITGYLSFIKLFILHWSIADEQCCDHFRWTAKGLSRTYTCIHPPLNSPAHPGCHLTVNQSSCCYSRCLLVIHFK